MLLEILSLWRSRRQGQSSHTLQEKQAPVSQDNNGVEGTDTGPREVPEATPANVV